MPSVPEDAFRSLLADCTAERFRAFVADLWRARGHAVRREGDLLVAGDETLCPALTAAETPETPRDARPVLATEPPDGMVGALGPADLRGMLLYDVDRERAAALFEEQFDRPLDDDWGDDPAADEGGPDAPSSDEGGPDAPSSDERADPAADDGADGDLPADDADGSDGASAPRDQGEDGRPPGRLRAARSRVAGAVAGLRPALGDRRVQAVALAVLLVLAGGAALAVTYEPAPATPSRPPFASGGQAPPVDGSYRVEAAVRTTSPDGTPFHLRRSRTYVPGDPAVAAGWFAFGGDGEWTTRAVYERGDRSYTRWSWTNATRYRRFRDSRTLDDRSRSVDATRTVFSVDETTGVRAAALLGLAGRTLGRLPYEEAGSTTYRGREVVRYVPTSGWATYDAGVDGHLESHLVREASGTVLVDAETGSLLYADVEGEAVPGTTWADVLTGDAVGFSVTYRVETGVDRPEAPPWVDALRRVNQTG